MADEKLDFGDDIQDKAAGEGELSKLTNAAIALQDAENDVVEAEAVLKRAQAVRDHIAQHVLPDMLKECGQSGVDLLNGKRVELVETIRASIPESVRAAAFKWLRKNDAGDLIKRKIVVSFGKGSDNEATAVLATLQKEGHRPEDKVEVHPQTLAAYVRERLEEGEDVPMELLGVTRFSAAKIVEQKRPTKRRSKKA